MAPIELQPLFVDEAVLRAPDKSAQWLGRVRALTEISARYAPRLEVPRPGDVWTEGDLHALIDMIVPFMGVDETTARQQLEHASFAELAQAFGQAMPLVTRAFMEVQDVVTRLNRKVQETSEIRC